MIKYKRTLAACYLSSIMMAFVSNITALVFVGLKELYNLSYSSLGILVAINFTVQIVVDFIAPIPIRKFGFKPLVNMTPFLIIFGVVIFILSPIIFAAKPIIGFIIGTVFFAAACGLLEVMTSPIVENLPTEHKAKEMSKLHSFYGLGTIIVTIVTTLLLRLIGFKNWQYVLLMWLALPALVFFMFLKAPIIDSVDRHDPVKIGKFLLNPIFILCFLAILFGAGAEIIMTQWASTFMEKSVGLPKVAGDILAVATFACMLTLGRYLYGKFGDKVNLSVALMLGALLSAICYVAVVFINNTVVAIIAVMLCGFGVSLLWPGTLSLSAAYFPQAGALLFAFMAGGGDIGAAIAPLLVGAVADISQSSDFIINLAQKHGYTTEQLSLKVGLSIGIVVSLIALLLNVFLYAYSKKIKIKSDTNDTDIDNSIDNQKVTESDTSVESVINQIDNVAKESTQDNTYESWDKSNIIERQINTIDKKHK